MVHLYALADHPARLPALGGIAQAALAAADAGGIDAIFSEVEAGQSKASEETILAHARVVEELAVINDAVLPARLARPYESEAALVDAIRGRSPKLLAALEHVRDCVELGVRVVREQSDAAAPQLTGGDYLRGRLAAVQSADRVADELDAALDGISRDRSRGVTATAELVLSSAYLLPRADVDAFRAAVQTVADGHPELAFVCVGPWPPYSFALVDGGS
jgi:Gas vesicle synthesis protein GvpL/GvpF